MSVYVHENSITIVYDPPLECSIPIFVANILNLYVVTSNIINQLVSLIYFNALRFIFTRRVLMMFRMS